MTKRPYRRKQHLNTVPAPDWSDHEITKPWELCTESERWRKLWTMLRKRDEPCKGMKERMCELLWESAKPLPYEGRRLLARLLDSRDTFFDVKLELKRKRNLEFERRLEQDFEWGIAIASYIEQHGVTPEEAIKKLFPTQVEQVTRRYKVPSVGYRELRPPWDEN